MDDLGESGADEGGAAGSPGGAVLVASPRPAGLTAGEVADRVAAGKVNDVPARSSRSVAEIVRANLFTRINAIIGVLFVIILIVGPIQDALFGGVIIANTLIGIIQEVRAKRTLDQLAIVGEAHPVVRRGGASTPVTPSQIVLDDVIELGPGDKVVVDGVIAESDNLEIDESLLTGEADPVPKQPGDQVLSGSFVVAGTGCFTATRVGRQAYAAQLAEEARRFTLVDSELRNGINRILKFVTYAIIPAGIALILSQLAVNDSDSGGAGLDEAIRRMVAGLVPMVPEGLVLMTSIAFAVGVVRLGQRACLVQELPAIEGLARVDVVCLDKTGTLTETGMDVERVHPLEPDADTRVAPVLGALGLADGRPNPSMTAIIEAYPPVDGWAVTGSAPFSSARRWSGATLTDPDGATGTWLLGAPDVLLPAGHEAPAVCDGYGSRGLRVLLLARYPGRLDDALSGQAQVAGAATPVAFVVIRQRVRGDASETLRYFADQNVATKIISGDNALSVGAVARSLDLRGADAPVDARDLPTEGPELADAVEAGTIFGRVGPKHKRAIVAALQSRGHTVAMTGDGVNDVLALKDADIGVAMGAGSPAARAVAQLVLLKNNFSALPAVVAEGRRVIGNIERVANLFLTKTAYSVLLAITVVLTGVPYPFLPQHLTLIGSLTIGIPAFFLALAPNTERARPNFVGRVLRLAVPAGALAATATLTAYFLARASYGGNLEAETSVAALTLFLVALWTLVIIARPCTWWRVLLVAGVVVSFAAVLVVPFLRTFFQLELVGVRAPLTGVAVAVVAAAVLEVTWRVLCARTTVASAGQGS